MTRITAAVFSVLLLAAGVAAGAGNPAPGGGTHLFVVPSEGAPSAALAETDARLLASYDSFDLVEAGGDDADRLQRAGADRRDDMREVTIGDRTVNPVRERRSLLGKRTGPRATGLAVVQFVGPVKDAWLARLRRTGVRVVVYLAQNGYLVHGRARELGRAADLLGEYRAVRAVVPFTPADKLIGRVRSSGRQRLAVQTLSGREGSAARSEVADAGRELRDHSAVGGFRTQYVLADAAQAAELAEDPGVVSIGPAPAPELLDEAQNQILAGQTTGTDPLLPSAPGYLALIDGIVGTTAFPFAVDVTDEGIDAGVVGTTHPDLQVDGGGATRLDYVDNFTIDPDAMDCGGHGTINAGIVGGFNTGTGATLEDAGGFNYGLGIAPRTRLGGSKIFRCSGAFSLTSSFTALTTNAYNKGARISSNSWGCGSCAGTYSAESQEYDRLVRDAVPGTAGNQEMVEVFSAGNDGPGGNTVGTPGNGKNMITVGASESVRGGGTDGCGVTNSGADDAHDIIDFSSRGPTPDGRIKPDIVGPGTHVVGTKPQHGSYTGSGVCTGTFPAGSTLYSLSSGTSHSTPALSGIAALFRHWYSNGAGAGTPPSPALTKAVLAQSGTDLAGGDDGDGGINTGVPNQVQGWGLANIQRTLSSAPRYFRDQVGADVLGATGETFSRTFAVQNSSEPVRVTLAFTDAFGAVGTNPVVNDLDLTVGAAVGTFKGNVFSGGLSAQGGTSDHLNNLESVYLPVGTSGNFAVEVSAANIAGDGVPGNADGTDQDFALTVSNAAEVTSPVLSQVSSSTAEQGGDGDGAVEPGESFAVTDTVKNAGNAGATGISGTLTGPGDVTIADGSSAWPDLTPAQQAPNADALTGSLGAGAVCGAPVQLSLLITSAEGATSAQQVTMQTGAAGSPESYGSTDVPKSIPDGVSTGTTSTLSVADPGTVKDVDVRIGSLTHTWVGDMRIDLSSPDGTIVNLVNRPGGINNDGDNFTNTVFDDEAAVAIGSGGTSAPYTGSFRPQNDQLSRFDNESQQGTWTLKLVDFLPPDVGTLQSWSVGSSPAVCGVGGGGSPPGPISGLAASGGVESVALAWDDTAGASDYYVFRRNPDGVSYPALPTATSTASGFTDGGRSAGVPDCYKVQAHNGSGVGALSGEVCATPASAGSGAGGGGTGGGSELPVLPKLDLSRVPAAIRVGRRGGFRLSISGTPDSQGALVVTTVRRIVVAGARRRLTLARRDFATAASSGEASVELRLGRRAFRALRRTRRLRVTLRAELGTLSATRTFRLKAPRRRP